MLKILKDVTIRHNGKEIYCKAGQIVDVKLSFDVNDETTNGIEVRYINKFRGLVRRVNVDRSKTVTLNTSPIHNPVEQKIRKDEEEEIASEEEETESPEETSESTEETQESTEEAPVKKGRPKKNK